MINNRMEFLNTNYKLGIIYLKNKKDFLEIHFTFSTYSN